jgi:hypothetical protein
MIAISENIYRRLADEKYDFAETEFSVHYLGRSESYFAFLKSSGQQISSESLLNLWGKLTREQEMYSAAINKTEHAFRKQMLVDWADLYLKLSEDVFTELCERAGAVKTESVHS